MAKIESSAKSKPAHEDIARRAHQIYEETGRIPGRDVENWLRAEAELTGAASTKAAQRDAAKAVPAARSNPKPPASKAPNPRTYA